MTYHYQLANNASQQRLVNKFYRRQKLNVSVNLDDKVLCCHYEEGIVAAGIIRTIEFDGQHLAVLRSVFVDQNHRRKGIARAICSMLLHQEQQTTFTLCEPHLASFYQSLGYEILELANEENLRLPNAMMREIKKGLTLLVKPL